MDSLTKLLSNLSHIDLKGLIVNKQKHVAGFGGTCDVYTAWSTRHGKKVAVKQVRAFMKKDESFAKRLAREIRIWATLNHPNVLPLFGYVVEGENMTPNLVSEWMQHGTLHEFKKVFPRCSEETCIMLYGIASGLSYLHSRGIIHADLKTQNVLISANGMPLLADFGLSLIISQSQSGMANTASYARGTVRWMAKELFFSSPDGGTPKHTTMTDMWALGMVTYELLSWKVPYYDKRLDHLVMLSIMKEELPEKTDDCDNPAVLNNLWALCVSCWSEPPARPTGFKVMAYLASLNAKVQSEYFALLDQLARRNPREVEQSFVSSQDTRDRENMHQKLCAWVPTAQGPEREKVSDVSKSTFGALPSVLVYDDSGSAPSLHNPIPIHVKEGGKLHSSSPELPDLSCFNSNTPEAEHACVRSVMSELFSWSSSSANADEHLYEF